MAAFTDQGNKNQKSETRTTKNTQTKTKKNQNTVLGQPALEEAHPGGGAGAIMCHFEVFHGDLLQCTLEMAGTRMAQVATTRWVCIGQQFTRRSDALLTFLWACGPLRAAALITDQGSEGSSS